MTIGSTLACYVCFCHPTAAVLDIAYDGPLAHSCSLAGNRSNGFGGHAAWNSTIFQLSTEPVACTQRGSSQPLLWGCRHKSAHNSHSLLSGDWHYSMMFAAAPANCQNIVAQHGDCRLVCTSALDYLGTDDMVLHDLVDLHKTVALPDILKIRSLVILQLL